jgi:hypothetical protein
MINWMRVEVVMRSGGYEMVEQEGESIQYNKKKWSKWSMHGCGCCEYAGQCWLVVIWAVGYILRWI